MSPKTLTVLALVSADAPRCVRGGVKYDRGDPCLNDGDSCSGMQRVGPAPYMNFVLFLPRPAEAHKKLIPSPVE